MLHLGEAHAYRFAEAMGVCHFVLTKTTSSILELLSLPYYSVNLELRGKIREDNHRCDRASPGAERDRRWKKVGSYGQEEVHRHPDSPRASAARGVNQKRKSCCL